MNVSGYYMFLADSNISAISYLYKYPFDPYYSVNTPLDLSHTVCAYRQFTITAYLQFNITYVLVITTPYDHEYAQGPFSIIIEGPGRTDMERMGMYTS